MAFFKDNCASWNFKKCGVWPKFYFPHRSMSALQTLTFLSWYASLCARLITLTLHKNQQQPWSNYRSSICQMRLPRKWIASMRLVYCLYSIALELWNKQVTRYVLWKRLASKMAEMLLPVEGPNQMEGRPSSTCAQHRRLLEAVYLSFCHLATCQRAADKEGVRNSGGKPI